jgi:hypothetical protein
MPNPGQSGGGTGQSETESVDIVHTSFFAQTILRSIDSHEGARKICPPEIDGCHL